MIRMDAPSCSRDVAQAVRRSLLGPADREQWAAHLAECESCRLTAAAMHHFAATPDMLPGDDRIIERAAAAAAARAGARGGHPRLWRLAIAAGLLLALGGVSTAAVGIAKRLRIWPHIEPLPAPAPPRPSPAPKSQAPRIVALAPARAPEPKAAPVAVTAEPARVPRRQARLVAAPVTAETRVPASEASVPTPEALFREAQAARTGGRLDEALALYRDLSRQFPDSREGQVALISLGQLALDRGAAADARAAFERYLARASGGALAEEALDGRASALAKLGLDELEAETWRELLRRFPRTVFRARAERRLAQLR